MTPFVENDRLSSVVGEPPSPEAPIDLHFSEDPQTLADRMRHVWTVAKLYGRQAAIVLPFLLGTCIHNAAATPSKEVVTVLASSSTHTEQASLPTQKEIKPSPTPTAKPIKSTPTPEIMESPVSTEQPAFIFQQSVVQPQTKDPTKEIRFIENYHLIDTTNKIDKKVVPKMIIIHWGGGTSGGGYAKSIVNAFFEYKISGHTGLKQTLDAHFGVGVDGIIQLLPMYEGYVQYSYGAAGYADAINIEMAGQDFIKKGKLMVPKKEIDNTVMLVADLMVQYNIPFKNIVGHDQADSVKEMYYLNKSGQRINKFYYLKYGEEPGKNATPLATFYNAQGDAYISYVEPDENVVDKQPVDIEIIGDYINPFTNQPIDRKKQDVGPEFVAYLKSSVKEEIENRGLGFNENGLAVQSSSLSMTKQINNMNGH